jgi:HAD superfamily hydrolase (TIGR01549 family)
MNLNKYKTIILDCDGVIFDSNDLKLDAFRDALKDYDKNIVDNFINYFRKNFGTSRYVLTRIFINKFLKKKLNNDLYCNIIEQYSKNCVVLYKKSKLTNGFLNFIDQYGDKYIYVASGSDEAELREVFKKKDLAVYFSGIFGSPQKKSEIVSNIVNKNTKCIMIGDSLSDMQAATNSKIDFIFMSDYSANKDMKKYKNIKTINNLGDLIE